MQHSLNLCMMLMLEILSKTMGTLYNIKTVVFTFFLYVHSYNFQNTFLSLSVAFVCNMQHLELWGHNPEEQLCKCLFLPFIKVLLYIPRKWGWFSLSQTEGLPVPSAARMSPGIGTLVWVGEVCIGCNIMIYNKKYIWLSSPFLAQKTLEIS